MPFFACEAFPRGLYCTLGMNFNTQSGIFPLLALAVVAAGFGGANVLLSSLLGPRRPNKIKNDAYECGIDPVGDARLRFSVKFYIIAMLFILFDIEAIFLYPWAVIYKSFESRPFAFAEMLLFVVLIVAGFFFIWKKGVLDWSGDRLAPTVRKSEL